MNNLQLELTEMYSEKNNRNFYFITIRYGLWEKLVFINKTEFETLKNQKLFTKINVLG